MSRQQRLSNTLPLFAQPDEKKEDEPEGEVVLDGDGRPMRPMTEEEKEQFGKDMMKFGGYHQRSPWRKRVLKFFITIGVLCGLGYAGYYFMPDDLAEKAKAKVLNFLEPGSVLADFLPRIPKPGKKVRCRSRLSMVSISLPKISMPISTLLIRISMRR